MAGFDDILITTWKEIGRFLGMGERSAQRRKDRLCDGDYIFRFWKRKGHKRFWVWAAWRSDLKRYVRDQGEKGELI